MVLRIGTEWCQHHGGVSCSLLFTPLIYCAISWASITRNKQKGTSAQHTPGHLSNTSICALESSGLDLRGHCEMRGVVVGPAVGRHSTSGRSEGWRRWVGVDQLLVLQLERPTVFLFFCFLWREQQWLGRERKGKKADKNLKESISCCLTWDSGKRTTHKPLRPPNSRIPLQGHDTPKAPSAKHTPPPLCWHFFLLFFPFSLCQFVCFVFCFVLHAQVPKLSNQSAPVREIKNLVL